MQKNNQIITFCTNNCCPVVEITPDNVILGDKNGKEGITTWTKSQFKNFIKAVKDGRFDLV